MIASLDDPRATGWADAPLPLDFVLPAELEATEPPEARGLPREGVRLLVSHYRTDELRHTTFDAIPEELGAGDLLVINVSGTVNAAIGAVSPEGIRLELHRSTRLPSDLWVVEMRSIGEEGTAPLLGALPGTLYHLDGGGTVRLLSPYRVISRRPAAGSRTKGTERDAAPAGVRLWTAAFDLDRDVDDHFAAHGFPIRYGYVRQAWPLEYYTTIYATEPGSAEMPSAGRAFTPEIITRLAARGTLVMPIVLHTGVASLESHEPPYDEYYRVPAATARAVEMVRAAGGRVIAVGTTVVRALETVTERDGRVRAGEGWTDLVIVPERGLRAIDGLLTGFHEPLASHLAMLETLAGRDHLRLTYAEALDQRYLWHEFGDLHLLLP